ncbi:MAG TPA: hypothetical protein EYP49_03105 [Anaerolineae bacterium]|nr:hypothetical protein [Anaerolineae bacterium]
MAKLLKILFFAVLLIAAGYFFGRVCAQVNQQYQLLLSFSKDLLPLALRVLLALGIVAVAAGIVAVLFRPFWVCIIAFGLSALAIPFGWEWRVDTSILALLYFFASLIYARGVAQELDNRLDFSVRPISESQSLLVMALSVMICGALYFGYAAQIEKEGFSIPSSFIEMAMTPMEKQIEQEPDLTPAQREEVLAKFRQEFEDKVKKPMEDKIKPYERFIPLAVAVGLLQPLVFATSLLSWIPILVLRLVFLLLTVLKVAKVVTEMREVRRLTLG